MFWADHYADEIESFSQGKSGTIIIRDEKTPSGRVHIGSMRGVAIHALVHEVLLERAHSADFLYEMNDLDPMDGIPSDLDENLWKEHLGKPLFMVPSPDSVAKNFAEYYAEEFKNVIREAEFNPTFYRNSETYTAGKMNEVVRIALDKASLIRKIYLEVSGSKKKEDWLPVSMVCVQCGKLATTYAHAWDGKEVSYRCGPGPGGAEGCGYEGKGEPWNGNAKLFYKPEWAAKWKVHGVVVEGGGKDHSTKGGSREVAERISREVFEHKPPMNIPYEFFLDKDGKKMSSSKGRGVSSREIANNFPPRLLRLALFGKHPEVQTSIDPNGELLALLYDWHDKIAEKYWSNTNDDDARLFELLYHSELPARRYYPRFSVVVFVSQMAHLSPETEFAALKGAPLTEDEKSELDERIVFAKKWLGSYAPEKYKFILLDTLPETVKSSLTATHKKLLGATLEAVEGLGVFDGPTLHGTLHDIKTKHNATPQELFVPLYRIFLNRDSGPQAGWFLSTLGKDAVLKRLKEALK